MAKIYNSVNDPQSQAGLLARNLYTSEQIEYKLRQKADKTQVYTKNEVDSKLVTLSSEVANAENTFLGYTFYLEQEDTNNLPLKWNNGRFISCLDTSVQSDGLSPIPLGWNEASQTLTSLFPSLDSGADRDLNNSGIYLGRQSVIRGGSFNIDSISIQQDPNESIYPTEVYSGSNVLWKQFEPNNRLIIKHSVDSNNNSLGANSLYTGELGININTGDIFIGWQGKVADPVNNVPLSGIKQLFSPQNYIKKNSLTEQIIQADSSVNIPSLMVKGSQVSLGSEQSRSDILQVYTYLGYKKVYVDSDGVLNAELININSTPSTSTNTVTHKIPIKVSGQTYYILLSNV